MLREILEISPMVSIIVCYVPDEGILQEIKRYVGRLYKFDTNYTEKIEDAKSIKHVYSDALIRPMLGDRWYIELNLDKVKPDIIGTIAKGVNNNSLTIAYTTHYGTYKKVADNNVLKQTKNVYMLYGGTLSAKDIYYAYEEASEKGGVRISDQLVTYIVRYYRYDVDKVFKLLQKVSSGMQINSRTDIVTAVGLGSISSLSFTVDILSSDLSTERKVQNAIRRWMQTLNDLLDDMTAAALLQQMQKACEDIANFKNLQVRGLVVGARREIEDEKVAMGIARLSRYENRIIENVSVMRVMWLRTALQCSGAGYAMSEDVIIRCLYRYMTFWCTANAEMQKANAS